MIGVPHGPRAGARAHAGCFAFPAGEGSLCSTCDDALSIQALVFTHSEVPHALEAKGIGRGGVCCSCPSCVYADRSPKPEPEHPANSAERDRIATDTWDSERVAHDRCA